MFMRNLSNALLVSAFTHECVLNALVEVINLMDSFDKSMIETEVRKLTNFKSDLIPTHFSIMQKNAIPLHTEIIFSCSLIRLILRTIKAKN